MTENDTKRLNTAQIESTAEDLFRFAIDREDVKALLSRLPNATAEELGAVEYELQILKIICVGWSLSYFIEDSPFKNRLTAAFWRSVHEFSGQLSEAAGGLIGKKIDYFNILKERLDLYVAALKHESHEREPAAAIGPAFAQSCGKSGDVHTIMTGARIFVSTVGQMRSYIENHPVVSPAPGDKSKLH